MIKTVTAKLAEDLKDAGFPQEAYFLWISDEEGNWHIEESSAWSSDEIEEYAFAAPTAEEILEQLPDRIRDSKNDLAPMIVGRWNKKFSIEYHVTFNPVAIAFEEDTLAEAAGKMYLHLKKKGLLPLTETMGQSTKDRASSEAYQTKEGKE